LFASVVLIKITLSQRTSIVNFSTGVFESVRLVRQWSVVVQFVPMHSCTWRCCTVSVCDSSL